MKRVSVVLGVAAAIGCGPPKPVGPMASIESFVVQPPMVSYFRELDGSEQKEQIRDWAVLGTVGRQGAGPDAAAAATYEMPPARLSYLDELYAFEHGRGRRVYLGERVLLFRDAEDPDPVATIGRLADRVRMENGEVPEVVEIYVVHDVRDEGTIRVDRMPDVGRDELFSAKYGYVEIEAKDVASIAGWLGEADDLTFAQVTPDGLRLGGRRFARTRTANVTIEDVAALSQAHEELDGPRAPVRRIIAALPPEAKAAAERIVEHVKADTEESPEAQADLRVVLAAVPEDQWEALGEGLVMLATWPEPRAPGFSLDPQWLPDPVDPEHPAMLARIRAFAEDPCRDLGTIWNRASALESLEPDPTRRTAVTLEAQAVRNVIVRVVQSHSLPDLCAAIKRDIAPGLIRIADEVALTSATDWNRGLARYHGLLQEAAARGDQRARDGVLIAVNALDFHRADTSVQCGRYMGLEGTRVGMTLFYTDLLAKLWMATDYGRSAPVVEIPGLRSMPHQNLPVAYAKEANGYPNTRIWFGPRPNSVSRAGSDRSQSFLFEHRFTRIYAAGRNPARPGEEMAPPESSRRSLGWWDQHYDDIADYEHEYHRLNQISKWSLITASLAESPMGALLRGQSVRRSFDFLSWHRATRAELRFSETLPVVRTPIAGKECVPLLASYTFENLGRYSYITGGVSTAPRSAPKQVPVIEPAAKLGARRPPIDDLGAGKAGTATRARPKVEKGEVTFVNADKARTRTPAGDIDLGTPKVQIGHGDSPGSLAIRAGGGDRSIGTLQIGGKSRRVELEWMDGAVEKGRRGAVPEVTGRQGADRLAASGRVVEAARMYRSVIPQVPETADDLARQVVLDAGRRNAKAVLRTVQKLEGRGAQLSPELRSAVSEAVSEIGSPAAARHVETALRAGKPLKNADGTLKLERGQFVVTRDIESLPRERMTREVPEDLSRAEVFIDDRLLRGREGGVADLGGHVAQMRARPNITVEAMERNALGGAIPDRMVEPTGRTWHRANRDAGNGSRHIVFVRYRQPGEGGCDDSGRTAVKSDDCAEQR